MPKGLRAIIALVVLRNKAIQPLLAAAQDLRPLRGAQNPSALDTHCDTIRTAMRGIIMGILFSLFLLSVSLAQGRGIGCLVSHAYGVSKDAFNMFANQHQIHVGFALARRRYELGEFLVHRPACSTDGSFLSPYSERLITISVAPAFNRHCQTCLDFCT